MEKSNSVSVAGSESLENREMRPQDFDVNPSDIPAGMSLEDYIRGREKLLNNIKKVTGLDVRTGVVKKLK